MTDGILTERWSNCSLFQIFNGSGKSAGAKNEGEVVRRFLAEVAFDHALIVNPAIDARSGLDSVIEHDGELAVKIRFRKRAEPLRRILR